jgi:hypothetical protein
LQSLPTYLYCARLPVCDAAIHRQTPQQDMNMKIVNVAIALVVFGERAVSQARSLRASPACRISGEVQQTRHQIMVLRICIWFWFLWALGLPGTALWAPSAQQIGPLARPELTRWLSEQRVGNIEFYIACKFSLLVAISCASPAALHKSRSSCHLPSL